ncbi:MAG: hypothetical protein IPN24_14680 [Betaproteobacteria bacterium]|nr:hypothetical protein [Betaproteobacteria bacterium]
MLAIAELFDRNALVRQGATLDAATASIIANRANAEREMQRIRSLMPQRPGATPAPRRAGLTAAEIEIKRLQAAAGQPRPGEGLVQRLQREHRERQAAAAAGSPPVVAPPPAPTTPSDASGTRAQRHALNEWSREQALATSTRMREQRGGWGR